MQHFLLINWVEGGDNVFIEILFYAILRIYIDFEPPSSAGTGLTSLCSGEWWVVGV